MNAQGTVLKSCLGPLARYGTSQETMSGRLEQVYLPLTQDWTYLGRGHYSSWILINDGRGEGGKMWALFKSLPGPLFTSGMGPWPAMALE